MQGTFSLQQQQQQKTKQKTAQHPQQLSQRSVPQYQGGPGHHKAGSITNKPQTQQQSNNQHPQQHVLMPAYDEGGSRTVGHQGQPSATLLGANNGHSTKGQGFVAQGYENISKNIQVEGITQLPTTHGQSLHKKSNSLMNSKMAQLILKGASAGTISGVTQISGSNIRGSQFYGNQQNVAAQGPTTNQQKKQVQASNMKNSNVHQNVSHLTNSIAGAMHNPSSGQTSFTNQNEPFSYSIDFHQQPHPPMFYPQPEYEDSASSSDHYQVQHQHLLLSSQDNTHMHLSQVPSSKLLSAQQQQLSHQNQTNQVKKIQPTYLVDHLLDMAQEENHSEQIVTQKKTQPKGSAVKATTSAQKGQKKQVGGGGSHHQRTQSDTFQNRNKNLGSSQQQKRAVVKNNFMEERSVPQIMAGIKPSHSKNPSISTGYFAIESQNSGIPQRNKGLGTSNQVQSIKKSSIISAHQQPLQQSNLQTKKSTKEKYNELKNLYNDLLEKHIELANNTIIQQQHQQQPQYQLQTQQTQPVNSKQASQHSQQISGTSSVGFYQPVLQQYQQQSVHDPNQQVIMTTTTITPRILTNNKQSQGLINQYGDQVSLAAAGLQLIPDQEQQQQQIGSKSIKHLPSKVDNYMISMAPGDDQIVIKQSQLDPQSALKMQLVQGVSRKAAGGHKRSISDGQELMFKFKQQSMQRYLYPQPSNQTIHGGGQDNNPLNFQQQLDNKHTGIIEEKNYSQRAHLQGPQPTAYQQPNHARRVSDDHQQKAKKQLVIKSQQMANKVPLFIENVQSETPQENTKPQTTDFNIKGFLIEMRNKSGNNIENLEQSRQDQQQPSFNSKNSSNQSRQQQQLQRSAMIIEENSPANEMENIAMNEASSLEIQRKMSLIDSQSLLKGGASKPNVEFNKIIQKYKKLRLDEKRGSSPQLLDRQGGITGNVAGLRGQNANLKPNGKKQSAHQHKRVKSDISDAVKITAMHQPITIHNGNNNLPININQAGNKQGPHVSSTLLNKKSSHQTSGSNIFSSDKHTPKKVTGKGQQRQQKTNNYVNGGGINFGQDAHLDGSSSKKVINVSIDLIKESELDPLSIGEEPNVQGGHWIVVENENNLNKKSKEERPNIINLQNPQSKGKQQPLYNFNQPLAQVNMKNFSGGQNEVLRSDKYKKMLQKYDNKKPFGSKALGKQSLSNSPSVKKLDPGLKPVGHAPPTYLHNIAKVSPRLIKPIKQQLGNLKESGQMAGTNTNSHAANKKAKSSLISTNIKQPVLLQNKQNQQQNIQQKQKIKQEQQSFTDAPANSVVQTQESPKISARPQIQQTINFAPNCERIDTQDSAATDPNISPRHKASNKLVKHIKLSFKQTGQAPSTTVDFYRIGKVLGKGAFGKVNLALHRLSQKFAAVKSINKQYLSEEAQTKKVMQEVVILKRTRHRNIVRLYEFFETQKHILFVIELCAGGDLLNYVRKRRRLKEDVAKSVFKQIVEGLGYCHSRSILHRDIKLDNILLDSEGEVKICDFGVSKIVRKGEKMTEQCGTPAYIAPEILRDKGYEGFAVDIWSAGVVLYAMLYGTVPFKANNMSELQKSIIKAKYTLKEDVSEDARDLLRGLLEKNPIKRLTIKQILGHRWLADALDQVQLFTEQEKDYIKNEFTYNDASRYNRNNPTVGGAAEGVDPGESSNNLFTEHMLDTAQDSMFKNATTKSVVLAPFNSTKSNLDEEGAMSLSDSVKELLQSRGCIKYAARVRDIDKQYEINNNADLDNGVYHKLGDEEEKKEDEETKKKDDNSSNDSLQTSFNKETSLKSDEDEIVEKIEKDKKKKQSKPATKKKSQTELEKLESLIQQQEDQGVSSEDNPNDVSDSNYPYGQMEPKSEKKENKHFEDEHTNKLGSSPRLNQTETINAAATLNTAQTLMIDDKITAQIEQFGFPKDFIIKSLNNGELNYATTSYYMLANIHGMTNDDKHYQQDQHELLNQSVSKGLV